MFCEALYHGTNPEELKCQSNASIAYARTSAHVELLHDMLGRTLCLWIPELCTTYAC